MKLIDKLVLKDLIGPFLNGMAMFTLLVFAAAYLFPATELLVKGVPGGTVVKLILFNLPSLVTQTFPMAMLLAGLMSFGRLSSDREAVAVFAAGISFPRAARSVVIMGALVSLAAYLWNDIVVPPASTAFQNLKIEAEKGIAQSDHVLSWTLERKDGKGLEGFVQAAHGYDTKTRSLRNVHIIRYTQDTAHLERPQAEVFCDYATPDDTKGADKEGLNWTYHDGYVIIYAPDKQTGRIETVTPIYFKTLKPTAGTPKVGKSFEQALHADITDPNRKSFRDLREEIQRDRKAGRDQDARGKEVDLWGKIALPLASLVFGVVGASLGVNTQRGGGKTVGFGMAIFIVFLYWVFYHATFVVGKNGGLPTALAAFLADIVGAIVGAFLAFRASR